MKKINKQWEEEVNEKKKKAVEITKNPFEKIFEMKHQDEENDQTKTNPVQVKTFEEYKESISKVLPRSYHWLYHFEDSKYHLNVKDFSCSCFSHLIDSTVCKHLMAFLIFCGVDVEEIPAVVRKDENLLKIESQVPEPDALDEMDAVNLEGEEIDDEIVINVRVFQHNNNNNNQELQPFLNATNEPSPKPTEKARKFQKINKAGRKRLKGNNKEEEPKKEEETKKNAKYVEEQSSEGSGEGNSEDEENYFENFREKQELARARRREHGCRCGMIVRSRSTGYNCNDPLMPKDISCHCVKNNKDCTQECECFCEKCKK